MPSHPDNNVSKQVARILLDSGCVQARTEEPFRLPSGWASPVYMDCRRLISFPAARRELVAHGLVLLKQRGCLEGVEAIAGAETSGIAFAAWMADTLDLPLVFVRKQTRGLGLGNQIVGITPTSGRLLLVDDLMAAGTSKVNFVRAVVSADARLKDIFVIFDYATFSADALLDTLKIAVHSLANWSDVLAVARERNDLDTRTLAELEAFLANPARWSEAHGGISRSVQPL